MNPDKQKEEKPQKQSAYKKMILSMTSEEQQSTEASLLLQLKSLKLSHAMQKLKNPSIIRIIRRNIALIKTYTSKTVA